VSLRFDRSVASLQYVIDQVTRELSYALFREGSLRSATLHE
jgi:hypothetical protein